MVSEPETCFVEVLCGQAQLGQVLCICGGDDAFGAWQLSRAVEMQRNTASNPRWYARVRCPAVGSEFKLAIRQPEGSFFWEPLEMNRCWSVKSSTKGATVKLFFGIPGSVLDLIEAEQMSIAMKEVVVATAEKAAWRRAAAGFAAFEKASCERTAMELAVAELAATQQAAVAEAATQQALAEQAAADQFALEDAAIAEAAVKISRLDLAEGIRADNSIVLPIAAKLSLDDDTIVKGICTEKLVQHINSENGGNTENIAETEADLDAVKEVSAPVTPLSAKKLCCALQSARDRVAREHQSCSTAWRSSLSDFNEYDEQHARERGVPAWAVVVVAKAQMLIEEAACIYKLLDVYETQVQVAKREGVALLRGPLLQMLEMCEFVARRLHAYVEPLESARAAFDQPETEVEWPVSRYGALLGSQRQLSMPSGVRQAPIEILSPVKVGRAEATLLSGICCFFLDSTVDLAEAAFKAVSSEPAVSIDSARDEQLQSETPCAL